MPAAFAFVVAAVSSSFENCPFAVVVDAALLPSSLYASCLSLPYSALVTPTFSSPSLAFSLASLLNRP